MSLSLAQIVERRKRSRIDRARQLADNIEVQAHILKSIELYNLEAEKRRLQTDLGQVGTNIPTVARAMAQTRLDLMVKEQAKLESETAFPIGRAVNKPYIWKHQRLIKNRNLPAGASTLDGWLTR